MELKEVIKLIKKYLSVSQEFFDETYPTNFICMDEEENLPKLSQKVLSSSKKLLNKIDDSKIVFTGETFEISTWEFTDVDLLDSSKWKPKEREFLNKYAFEITLLRNEWRNDKESNKVIHNNILDKQKEKRKIFNEINKILSEDLLIGKKAREIFKFWIFRGSAIDSKDSLEVAEYSFEEILENHPEYLE